MPFFNWIEGLGQNKTRELQKDLAIHYMNGVDQRPFKDVPASALLSLFDNIVAECHTKGIDLVKEYSSDESKLGA